MSRRTKMVLDDDVAERLLDESRRTGRTPSEVADDAIRNALGLRRGSPDRFVVKARPMNLRPGFDLDDIEGLFDRLEGPFRR